MKKFLAAVMIAIFAITLTACGNNNNNDDDPVVVDCDANPDDPSCVVDLECEPGEEEVNGECVVIDTRTPEEIAADLISENFDGSMDHVGSMMENMNFDDGMTLMTEFNVDVLEGDGTPHILNLTVKDEVVYGEFDVIRRTVTGVSDEDEFEFVLLIEETNTGFIVYYDTTFLRSIIDEEESVELQEILDTLDANGTWFMFKFDDSLSNLVEFEVLKEMAVLALYQEVGENVFEMIAEEIDYALGVTLATYGFDFPAFVQYLIDGEYDEAEFMIETMNMDGLMFDLDQLHLVPEIVYQLQMIEPEMMLLDPTWVLADEIAFLELNGTEAWLNQLTDDEISNFLTIQDPMLGEAYDAYVGDVLDHWLVMQILSDPDVQMALDGIPGFDTVAFINTMDLLDYDAWYLEDLDLEALGQAVYDGYQAYDVFVGELNATSPQWASILTHFGGMGGLVDALQEQMVYVDDFNLGIENLEMFEEYITPEYYLGIGLYDVVLEVTEDFEIVTTATVEASATSQLFADFTEDLYWYLDAFETFDLPYVDVFNCPELAECDTWEEYPEIMDALGQLGDVVLTVEYDPFAMDGMALEVQFADFVQELIVLDDPENGTTVNDFSINISMSNDATIDVPTDDITDVNQTVEDFARFSLVMEAHSYLQEIKEYYMFYPEEATTVNTPIVAIQEYIGASVAFDSEASYFRLIGNAVDGYDVELQLVWLDGTNVFTEPLLLSTLDAQFGQGTGAPTRAEFVMWLDKVDPDNFNMTKLFLVYMWERYQVQENFYIY